MNRCLVPLAAALFAAGSAAAAGHPFTELEIPLPDLVGTHARAVGMGRAHIAVAEDASAITWNPAGLVHVKRVELSTSISSDDQEIETTWFGNGADGSSSDAQIGGLHFIYPFPTYRGSLVLGFGIDRLRNYDLDYIRSGLDSDVSIWGGRPGLLTDRHQREGKLTAVSGAVAWDVTPRLSVGGTVQILTGSILDEQSFRTEDADDATDTLYLDDYFLLDMDLSGYSAMAGFLYQASPQIRFGGVLGTPRVLDFERVEQIRFSTRYDDGSEIIESDFGGLADEEITFPWWAGFGVSFAKRGFMLAADVRYSDWQAIEDKVGDTEFFLKPYYDEKLSFSIGGEYLFPAFPLRVRAGYGYDPVPFTLTYCPFDDCLDTGRDPAEVDVELDKDRNRYSVGAGYLFGSAFALDLAFETGSYERTHSLDPSLYSEKRSTDRFIATGAYRF